jgi:hypothetical protein
VASVPRDPEASDFEKGPIVGLLVVGLASQCGEATAGRIGITAAKNAFRAWDTGGKRTVALAIR